MTDSKNDPKNDVKTDLKNDLKKDDQAAGSSGPDDPRDLRELLPIAARGDGLPSSVMNPAFYPKNLKPEVQHTEAEKAGSEWPGTKADKKAFDDANMEVAGPSRVLPPRE